MEAKHRGGTLLSRKIEYAESDDPAELCYSRGWTDGLPVTPPTDERILAMLAKTDVNAIRAVVPSGSPQQVARVLKGFADAGLRVPKILDYSGMAGLKFAARSPAKVMEAEDEFLRLVGEKS